MILNMQMTNYSIYRESGCRFGCHPEKKFHVGDIRPEQLYHLTTAQGLNSN